MTASSRRDPQPMGQGWETALVAGSAIVVLAGLLALAGMGIAAYAFGGGWVWPHGSDAMTRAVIGLAAGSPGRGIAATDAGRLAAYPATYGCIAALEACGMAALAVLAATVGHRSATDAGRGMATRAEAADALGIGRLRSARALIRPDIHARRGRAAGR